MTKCDIVKIKSKKSTFATGMCKKKRKFAASNELLTQNET